MARAVSVAVDVKGNVNVNVNVLYPIGRCQLFGYAGHDDDNNTAVAKYE